MVDDGCSAMVGRYMYVCMMYVHVCMYVCIMHVCMYVCIY